MPPGRKVTLCASVTAVVVLWCLAIHGGLKPFQQASAATTGSERLSASTAKPPAPPKGKPEFSATFFGSKLNTKVWDTCYPGDSQSGCRNSVTRNTSGTCLARCGYRKHTQPEHPAGSDQGEGSRR